MRLKQESALPEIGSNEAMLTRSDKLETNWRRDDKDAIQKGLSSEIGNTSDLPSGWDAIDYECLAEIGFTKTHLKQVAQQQKLTPSEVQDSINFFAFDLSHNDKRREIKGAPLNFLMGIIRKGIPYVPPANYISFEDESRIKYLAALKAREEARAQQEQEIKTLALRDWFRSLSEADKATIKESAPAHARERGPAQQLYIEAYFEEKIWPSLESKFSKEACNFSNPSFSFAFFFSIAISISSCIFLISSVIFLFSSACSE
jgi:hypothetical protein